uniref:Uncharacterized protein n=1 Tax=Tanacetum cinerariifolium TaxID=118510 RepID=A0A6L2J1G2_TANCI|nr:hypothetical protein [Tanacetum cinerariifolium]
MGKALFEHNGERCGSKGGRGGFMTGRGGGWLAKRSIVSNEGCGGGGLVSVVVNPRVNRRIVREILDEVIRENGGDTIGIDGGVVWATPTQYLCSYWSEWVHLPWMSTPVFVNPDISTQADEAQSSRVLVPLPEDPYEAIRQAYLVRMDTESKLFEGEADTPESPHTVAPPTCRVEESEGFGTFGARSTTTRMAGRVPPAMSPGLSVSTAEVAAMSDLAFCKRFRSSYDSSPSPTFPVRKRYRGTYELILDTDSEEDEEVEESSDSDTVSEDAEDEGPTAEYEDHATGDEGLVAGDEGPAGSSGCRIAVSEPLGLGYGALRRQELELEGDHVYSTFEVGRGSGSALEPERSKKVSASRQPTLTMWTDPEDATPTTLETEGFLTELGAQVKMHEGLIRDYAERIVVTFGALWRPVLALEAWAGRVDTRMTDMSRAGYDDHRLVHDMLLQQNALQ